MFEKTVSSVTHFLLAIGMIVLAMMMFLTALDVALRYLFNRPIPGALEMTEYMMALFVPFGVAYCAHEKSHVAVDFILDKFSAGIRKWVDAVTLMLTLAFVAVMTWGNILSIKETYVSKMTSAVLLIPAYPFVAAVSLGLAVYGMILLIQWLHVLRR